MVGLTAAATFARTVRDEDAAYASGAAFGAVAVALIVGGLLRLRSKNAGYIGAIVVCALSLLAAIGSAAQDRATVRDIEAAVEELDLGLNTYEPSPAEVECMERSGFGPDDLLTALTDTGAAGGQRQLELLRITVECAPDMLLSEQSVEQYRLAQSGGFGAELSSAEARCVLVQALDRPDPVGVLSGTELDQLLVIIERCFEPETFAAFSGIGGTAVDVGDDPTLDRLAERCDEPDPVACDLLWFYASVGGDYEQIADSCGGLGFQSELFCTPGLVDEDGNGFADATSPGWAPIVAACRDGDMMRCDFAFLNSELSTESERVGQTCGERVAVNPGGNCVWEFGETAD